MPLQTFPGKHYSIYFIKTTHNARDTSSDKAINFPPSNREDKTSLNFPSYSTTNH